MCFYVFVCIFPIVLIKACFGHVTKPPAVLKRIFHRETLPSSLSEKMFISSWLFIHVVAVNVRGSFVMYSCSVSFQEYYQFPGHSKVTIYKLIAAIVDVQCAFEQ